MAPTTTPGISLIGVLHIGSDHIEVHRHPTDTITTIDIRGQHGTVLTMHVEGDTPRDRHEALLAIAAKIRQQALDLIAEDAPTPPTPGQ